MTDSITRSYDRSTGFVGADELVLLADDGAEPGVAGTTTVPCAVAGGICPSGAGTPKC
jgi:hypothetical protein